MRRSQNENKKHLTPMNNRYDQHKRRASLLLAMLMLIVYIVPYGVSAAVTLTPIFTYNQIEEIVNSYSDNPNVEFTIATTRKLKSFSSGNDDYTLYALHPYGYAVFLDETLSFMEGALTPESLIPIDLAAKTTYYYAGPGRYFSKNGNVYIHTSGEVVSNDTVVQLSNVEGRVRSAQITAVKSNQATARSSTPEQISIFVQKNYFRNLTNFGNNQKGTCVVVALAMLLGYYDNFINDDYVPSMYEDGTGTSNDFHLYLNQLVYGTSTPDDGGIYLRDVEDTINQYLDILMITADLENRIHLLFTADLVYGIINRLSDKKPVVAAMEELRGASWNHAVLVYGVTYNTDRPVETAIFTCHMGWYPGSTTYNAALCNATWFYEYSFITCTLDEHDNESPWRMYDDIYHYSLCHCGEIVLDPHVDMGDGYCYRCEAYVFE